MTKRDFFRILIKIFGLYSAVITIFTYIPQNISSLYMMQDDVLISSLIVLILLLTISFFIFILLKADLIIDKLKLDKGFDDDLIVLGNLTNQQIFKVSIIVIGGFLIVDYTPSFLFDIVNAFKNKATLTTIEGYNVNYFALSIGFLNLLIGFFFITNYKRIASFLDKKE
jgi:hypothetical protein